MTLQSLASFLTDSIPKNKKNLKACLSGTALQEGFYKNFLRLSVFKQ